MQQDKGIDDALQSEHPAIHAQISSGERNVPFIGMVSGIDADKVGDLTPEEQAIVVETRYPHKKAAFLQVAVLPTFMLICYLVLYFYFKSKGGYKPVELDG